MTTFLWGFFGAVLCLILAALCGMCGWLICQIWHVRLRRQTPTRTEGENRQLMQEQAAFRQLQNYSAERAYGLLDGEESEKI